MEVIEYLSSPLCSLPHRAHSLYEVNTMPFARRTLATACAVAAVSLLSLGGVHNALLHAQPLPQRALDDATIVAIFDAANTADISPAITRPCASRVAISRKSSA
jgi:hypothetical protein